MPSLADALIATMFAPVCVSCGCVLEAPSRSPVCDACWARIRLFDPPADVAVGSRYLSRVRAAGPFEDVLRDVVHALKFQNRRSLAVGLGPVLRAAAADLIGDATAVVPVPLHPWRQWTRGYNQAERLAATLGRPVWQVLRRGRATQPQTSLDRAARHDNVAHAFAVGGRVPGSGGRVRRRIAGCTLLLVDDVLTTGATLEACAQALCEAGAAEVRAVTVARAALR
jgi:ComF family protein